LRELLNEELANKANAAGRAADEAMALALLKDFGAPSLVADRYRPAGGATRIPAREGRLFTWIAIGGVLAQWALSFPLQVVAPADGTFLARFAAWSTGSGLHAFAWPGVMAMCAIAWAWFKHRNSGSDTVTLSLPGELRPQEPLDPDRVNRWAWGAALIGFAIGMPLYATAPAMFAQLPAPVREVFMLDDGFVRERGPWMLALWAVQLVVFLVVLVNGRWRQGTRYAAMALDVAGAGLLAWFIAGGPMFQTPTTDGFAKLIIALITLIILLSTGARLWREQARVGRAAAPNS
jgi:hypothetical protein